MPDSDGITALNWAAQKGYKNCMSVLLAAGANPNGLSRFNRPAILEAARYGHLDCVKLLIEYGADPTIKLDNGCGPLEYAAIHGHIACVEELLKCNSITDYDRNTALFGALLNDQHDCAQALRLSGANNPHPGWGHIKECRCTTHSFK